MPNRQEATVSLTDHPEFLALLGSESFRQEVTYDPAVALAKFGVELDAKCIPESIDLPADLPPRKNTIIRYTGLL